MSLRSDALTAVTTNLYLQGLDVGIAGAAVGKTSTAIAMHKREKLTIKELRKLMNSVEKGNDPTMIEPYSCSVWVALFPYCFLKGSSSKAF
jgi:hypothetical protein